MYFTSGFPLRRLIFPILLVFMAWAFFINPVIKEVSAGIAILLFGMIMLEDGFHTFTEGPLQKLLKRTTDNLYKAWGLGFISTAVLQSSALVSVIVLSFLSAGLLSLPASIALMFGSNVGTTTTAWIVSTLGFNIDVAALSMPLLVFGIVFVLQSSKAIKGVGYILAGIGFFFLGIHFMQAGFQEYKESLDLTVFAMPGVKGLLIYTLIGIGITVLMQSSSASMVLILTTLEAGQINYTNALALTIGANVGTTFIALIGSINSNVDGRRLAGAHFLTKFFVAILVLIFVFPLRDFVDYLSELFDIRGDNFPVKLSVFHSMFNILVTILLWPFIRYIVRMLRWIIPDKKVGELDEIKPKYLTESVLLYPQTAIRALLDESKYLFEETTFTVVAHGLNLNRTAIKGDQSLKEIVLSSTTEFDIDIENIYYNKMKIIYVEIIEYATLAEGSFSMSPDAMSVFSHIKIATRNQVEIIKNIRGLRVNINLYMHAENEFIRREYNQLRRKVAKALRVIYLTGESEDPSQYIEELEKIKHEAVETDVLKSGRLSLLISEHRVTGTMAASLANDSVNVSNIIRKLVETAELLYIARDTILRFAENTDAFQN